MSRAQTAVVTGAARGIGRAIAENLLSSGHRVHCWDWSPKSLAATVGELDERYPGRVLGIECDISSDGSVEAAVESFKREGERLGILVNNAASWKPSGRLADIPSAMWERDLAMMLGGPQRVTAAFDDQFDHGAAIVTIASVHGLAASSFWGTYDIAKAGLIQWARVVAGELGPRSITSNVVSPGIISTTTYEDADLQAFHVSAGVVPRLGSPEDVARAVAFLAHPDNGFITGANLIVDGGMTSRLQLTATEQHSPWPSTSKGNL